MASPRTRKLSSLLTKRFSTHGKDNLESDASDVAPVAVEYHIYGADSKSSISDTDTYTSTKSPRNGSDKDGVSWKTTTPASGGRTANGGANVGHRSSSGSSCNMKTGMQKTHRLPPRSSQVTNANHAHMASGNGPFSPRSSFFESDTNGLTDGTFEGGTPRGSFPQGLSATNRTFVPDGPYATNPTSAGLTAHKPVKRPCLEFLASNRLTRVKCLPWCANLRRISPGFRIHEKCLAGLGHSDALQENLPIVIGRGGFGEILLGQFNPNWLQSEKNGFSRRFKARYLSEPLIVKSQRWQGRESKIAAEAQILGVLSAAAVGMPDHARPIPLAYGYWRAKTGPGAGDVKHHILMEYSPGGDWFEVLFGNRSRQYNPHSNSSTDQHILTRRQLKIFLQQLLHGVRFCHRNGVIHRDLKIYNFLISKYGNVQIADFGLAYCCQDPEDLPKQRFQRFVGTVIFCSPEQRSTLFHKHAKAPPFIPLSYDPADGGPISNVVGNSASTYNQASALAAQLVRATTLTSGDFNDRTHNYNTGKAVHPVVSPFASMAEQGHLPDYFTSSHLSSYDYKVDIFCIGVAVYNAWTKGIPGLSIEELADFENRMRDATNLEERTDLCKDLVRMLDERQRNSVALYQHCQFYHGGGQTDFDADSDLGDLLLRLLSPVGKRISINFALNHGCFAGMDAFTRFTENDLRQFGILGKLVSYRNRNHLGPLMESGPTGARGLHLHHSNRDRTYNPWRNGQYDFNASPPRYDLKELVLAQTEMAQDQDERFGVEAFGGSDSDTDREVLIDESMEIFCDGIPACIEGACFYSTMQVPVGGPAGREVITVTERGMRYRDV